MCFFQLKFFTVKVNGYIYHMIKIKNLRTGFFADEKTFTKVHIVNDNNLPICNSRISKNKTFQFNAGTVVFEYIECEHCKKIIKNI